MKKFLPIFALLSLILLFLPKVVLAYTQVGCQATGPTYQIQGGGSGNEYVCNPGAVKNGSTCVVSQSGYNAGWSPSASIVLTDVSGCVPASEFISAGAPKPWFINSPSSFGQELDQASQTNEVSSHPFYFDAFSSIANSASIAMLGNPASTTTTNSPTSQGAASFFAGGIDTLMQTKPASSVDYIAYMGSRLHVPGSPEVAYAAPVGVGGRGYSSLTPVLQIWTVTRNLAYVAFAIIFVMVGLMIMFRVKIDPKTAANIQNALPKIIFALILVTFSYAIAGFLIDLMYVLLGLIITLFGTMNQSFAKQATSILSGSIFDVLKNGIYWQSTWSAAQAINEAIRSFLVGIGTQNQVSVQNTVGQLLGGLGQVIAFLIFAVAIIVALFKTWLTLLGAYVSIILGIIMAPLQLMMDAIPGQNQFTAWIKTMVSSLLTFPLVLIMISLGAVLATNFGQSGNDTGFVPPLIGGSSQQAIQSLIGIGIILTIPKALAILQEVLKAPAFKYGMAWAEPLQYSAKKTGAGAKWGGAQGYNSWYDRPGGAGEALLASETLKQERIKAYVTGGQEAVDKLKPGTVGSKLGKEHVAGVRPSLRERFARFGHGLLNKK